MKRISSEVWCHVESADCHLAVSVSRTNLCLSLSLSLDHQQHHRTKDPHFPRLLESRSHAIHNSESSLPRARVTMTKSASSANDKQCPTATTVTLLGGLLPRGLVERKRFAGFFFLYFCCVTRSGTNLLAPGSRLELPIPAPVIVGCTKKLKGRHEKKESLRRKAPPPL